MPDDPDLRDNLQRIINDNNLSGIYPDGWAGYVGQGRAKRQLEVIARAARKRGEPAPHVFITSEIAGIGKTTLGILYAAQAGADWTRVVSGSMDRNAGRRLLNEHSDGDVIVWDEFHTALEGGKSNTDWLLSYLSDGTVLGPHGSEEVPQVTLVAMTTEVGTMERRAGPLVSRFRRAALQRYSINEAIKIAAGMTVSVFGDLPNPSADNLVAIVEAADHNPRTIGKILLSLRDLVTVEGGYDSVTGYADELDEVLTWVEVTHDGIPYKGVDYLLALYDSPSGSMGEAALRSAIEMPSGIEHVERILTRKGLVARERTGRVLTKDGLDRARSLSDTRTHA